MDEDEYRLTPDQARERFGELTVPVGNHRVHRHFSSPEGEWMTHFDTTNAGLVLSEYRLLKRRAGVKPVMWRPKGKR